MMSGNIRRLKVIAEGLGELCKDVVFVGGSVAELYADDPAATDIRPTMDVDCVIELATYGSLQDFEQMLRGCFITTVKIVHQKNASAKGEDISKLFIC